MRTKIELIDPTTVRLKALDPRDDEPIDRTFHIPANGGYVRDGNGNQVCDRLERLGSTLTASNGESLLRLIRHEWAAYRRHIMKNWL